MLISDQMPDLSRYSRPEEQINALYQYIFSLKQQINHVLSNLDSENLGQELSSTIQEIQDAVSAAVQGTAETVQETKSPWQPGAIYLTGDAAQDPAQLFGGTWEQVTSPLEGVTAWQRKE